MEQCTQQGSPSNYIINSGTEKILIKPTKTLVNKTIPNENTCISLPSWCKNIAFTWLAFSVRLSRMVSICFFFFFGRKVSSMTKMSFAWHFHRKKKGALLTNRCLKTPLLWIDEHKLLQICNTMGSTHSSWRLSMCRVSVNPCRAVLPVSHYPSSFPSDVPTAAPRPSTAH